jgi:hypothetical protein
MKVYEIPELTIRATINLDPLRINNESLPRLGRPSTILNTIKRAILRFVR